MTDRTTDERTDERGIDYEYRAAVPAVPDVGATDTGPDAFRITGTPELAETPERFELIEGETSVDRQREASR